MTGGSAQRARVTGGLSGAAGILRWVVEDLLAFDGDQERFDCALERFDCDLERFDCDLEVRQVSTQRAREAQRAWEAYRR